MFKTAGQYVRFVRRAVSVMAEYGIADIPMLVFYELFDEWRLRAQTSQIIGHDELGLSRELQTHGHMYAPAPYLILRRAFAHLPDTNGLALVDYGCGLGRILIFASQYPFKRVVGIEASQRLAASADRLLAGQFQRSRPRSESWTVENCDARQFVPPENSAIFFFNDPFDATVMNPVLDRIVESQVCAPRPIWCAYINPSCPDVFEQKGFAVFHRSVSRAGKGLIIYHRDIVHRSH